MRGPDFVVGVLFLVNYGYLTRFTDLTWLLSLEIDCLG